MISIPNHVTVGVYPNGEYKINIVKEEHLAGHIQYNVDLRPGRVLFVDGKYAVGWVFKEEFQTKYIKKWEEKISKMNIDSSIASEKYW